MITTNNILPERQVKNLALVLASLFLADTFRDWELINLMLADNRNWDFSSILFLIPKIILPIGLWGIWNLKQYGWVLTAFIITFLTVSIFLTTIMEIKWSINNTSFDLYKTAEGQGHLTVTPIDNALLDKIFGRKPIIFYVGQLIIIGTIIYFINRQSITDIFKISKKTQFTVLGLASAPVLMHGLTLLI